MSFPTEPLPVPNFVVDLAEGREVTAVWLNELGGVDVLARRARSSSRCTPTTHAALLVSEAERMRWAIGYHPAPRVLSSGPGWLHTAALSGRSAVDPHWVARPRTATRAIGEGLRHLHDALPVADCPFGAPSWMPADAPPADLLVVCHGDALRAQHLHRRRRRVQRARRPQ